MISVKSKALMTKVLKLAEGNLANNKIPIAALVASKNGNDVICEAVNNDGPLEHAELIALSEAMRLLNKKRLNDYVLFTNLAGGLEVNGNANVSGLLKVKSSLK
mgnify:CR=1 FL=1